MTVFLFQTTFDSVSGMPEDSFVNTLHFDCPDGLAAANVVTRVQNFYINAQTTGFAIADFLADELNTDATTKVYNAETPPPHVPEVTSSWNLPALSASGGFPQEVAICMSYKADPVAGVDLRSTRGRVYLGPFNVAAADGFTVGPPQNWSNPVRVRTAARDTIAAAAAVELLDANDADGVWVVWSRKEATGYIVTNGFVDNAFDTQRRRGVEASARSTFS